jgi:hypothetical protein
MFEIRHNEELPPDLGRKPKKVVQSGKEIVKFAEQLNERHSKYYEVVIYQQDRQLLIAVNRLDNNQMVHIDLHFVVTLDEAAELVRLGLARYYPNVDFDLRKEDSKPSQLEFFDYYPKDEKKPVKTTRKLKKSIPIVI